MSMKTIFIAVLLVLSMALFTGCGNESEQAVDDNVSVITNNDLTVHLLADSMKASEVTKKPADLLDSIKAEVADNTVDFTSLTYSDDIVCLGDVVYVEGVIPKTDYPSENVLIGSDPKGIVSFENAALTNKDDNSVLTLEVVGEEVGTTTVLIGLEDSESYYSFDLEVVDSSSRSAPSASGYTVYCTPTGGKYHSYGCSYLRGNGIAISLDEALAKGLGACSRCNP